MEVEEPVSSTCATHGTQAQGLGGAVMTQTAPALPSGRMGMGRMEGASGIRIGRALDLVFASRKCKFSVPDETFLHNLIMINENLLNK